MSFELTRDFLGWCTLINMGLLLWWFLAIVFLRDFVKRMHGKWFKLSDEDFDKLHYAGMTLFKIFVLVFNLVPYLAMRIVG